MGSELFNPRQAAQVLAELLSRQSGDRVAVEMEKEPSAGEGG